METRCPFAKWDGMADAGTFKGGPYRGVLHMTQGSSYAGARQVYLAKRVAPHFTLERDKVYQHVDLRRAARALANLSGGVQTNLWSAIQIEIVGYSDRVPDEATTEMLKRLMIWIEAQTGIQPWAPPFVGGEGYGVGAAQRMKPTSWLQFPAWCGHQHVPENAHWDPGKVLPVDRLFDRGRSAPVADGEIRVTHPPRLVLARPQGDGYWVVAYDGGVFAFGAARSDMTQIGGDPVERIIAGTVWPDGEGLLLMGEDGGMFALGSAQYHGRVYFG